MGAPRRARDRRVESALPRPGEASLLSNVWSVGRIRLERVGQGLGPVCCGLSELQAQLGTSLRRLLFDFLLPEATPSLESLCLQAWLELAAGARERVGIASTVHPKSE